MTEFLEVLESIPVLCIATDKNAMTESIYSSCQLTVWVMLSWVADLWPSYLLAYDLETLGSSSMDASITQNMTARKLQKPVANFVTRQCSLQTSKTHATYLSLLDSRRIRPCFSGYIESPLNGIDLPRYSVCFQSSQSWECVQHCRWAYKIAPQFAGHSNGHEILLRCRCSL